MRETNDAIERAGIDRTLRQAEIAELILLLLDRSEPLSAQDHLLLVHTAPLLLVATKADLPAVWEPSDLALAGRPLHVVSAERGDGLDELIAAVVTALVPIAPGPDAGVPFRQVQLDRLKQARAALEAGNHELAIQAIQSVYEDASREQS
jgi:tRNA modification GTPase